MGSQALIEDYKRNAGEGYQEIFTQYGGLKGFILPQLKLEKSCRGAAEFARALEKCLEMAKHGDVFFTLVKR